jgi:hypothetical protein
MPGRNGVHSKHLILRMHQMVLRMAEKMIERG